MKQQHIRPEGILRKLTGRFDQLGGNCF
jgi:hypothetical protein